MARLRPSVDWSTVALLFDCWVLAALLGYLIAGWSIVTLVVGILLLAALLGYLLYQELAELR